MQRQEVAKEKSDDEKKKEALKKAGEAALETPQGKAVKEKVLADPLVKTVEGRGHLDARPDRDGRRRRRRRRRARATGKELPFQPPAIPLDKITPGLSAQVKYEGPVNAPTFVGLTLTLQGAGAEGKKPSSKSRIAIAAEIGGAQGAAGDVQAREARRRQEKAEEDAFVQA